MDAVTSAAADSLASDVAYPPPRQAWFACTVLTLGCILAFMDRGILSLFVVPIQRDIGLSDTQMGLLIGFAFGIFNAIFGLPIGRWVDLGNRKLIASLGVFIWSVANGACGLASNFVQLFVARMGVGAGEGAVSPASVSLIADFFPPGKRGKPMGLFYSGMHIGSGGVLLFGGLLWYSIGDRLVDIPILGAVHSWQAILIGFAGIGLVVAPLTLLISEPPRLTPHGRVSQPATIGDTVGFYRRNSRALFGHNGGFCLQTFTLHAGSAWLPTILMRSQGWSLIQTGLIYGTMVILIAPIGTFSAGILGDRMLKAGRTDARLILGMYAACGTGLSGLVIGLTKDPLIVSAALGMFAFCGAFALPLGPAALQEAMPNTMRGQAIAIYVFCANVIAGGGAAVGVGMLTQYVFRDPSRTNEAFGLVAVVACSAAVIVLGLTRRPFRRLVATQLAGG